MALVYVLSITLLLYLTSLIGVTKSKFNQRNLNPSFPLLIAIPFYILLVHVKLAIEKRDNPKFSFFIIKSFIFDFNVAVVILAEIMLFHATNEKGESFANRGLKSDVNKFNREKKIFNKEMSAQLSAA